ncbi:MAG: DUF1704 domain-containing protein [Bdellovibrionales bacterium]|nr:DUF1704 domain-containing protein [Bdellovibrionales bacterium]
MITNLPHNDLDPSKGGSPYRTTALTLIALEGQISYLNHINPSNLPEAKQQFLNSNSDRQLNFTYAELPFESDVLQESLRSLSIPQLHSEIASIFDAKRIQLLLQLDILQNRGIAEKVIESSILMWGQPSQGAIDQAHAILSDKSLLMSTRAESRLDACISGRDFAVSVESLLREIGEITGQPFQMVAGPGKPNAVLEATKQVRIDTERSYTELEKNRLLTHEVMGHVARSSNGYNQADPLNTIFGTGLPGYDATEEGIALYGEELKGFQSGRDLRNFAARLITVRNALSQREPHETYQELLDYGVAPDDAWRHLVRAYRCGGLIKDHIYFQGFVEIRNYIAHGGDVTPLFCGKFGLADLPKIQSLLSEKIIESPTYIPAHYLPFAR